MINKFLLVASLILFVSACEQSSPEQERLVVYKKSRPAASLVLKNATVYTLDSSQPWAESIAIVDDKIAYVGSIEGTDKFLGESTDVIDLQGKFVMPGLIDAHVHPVLGGMEVATQCLFPPSAAPEEIKNKLRSCIEENPETPWIVGGRWSSTFFDEHSIQSPIELLDQVSTEQAISLADDTGHNRWVNSKALTLVGFDKTTHIPGGEIGLDSDGNPDGMLMEAAIWPVLQAINEQLKPTPEQYLQAARSSLKEASRYGFTGIKEAGDADQGVIAYKKLADANELKVHLMACIAVRATEKGHLDVDSFEKIRKQNRGNNLDTDCAKIFLDGVPSAARTAAMLNDYLPVQGEKESHRGKLLLDPFMLKTWMTQLDERGVTVKVHTAGDRAVRVTLDAIEFARKKNGDSGLRHELGHSGFIDHDDIPRFAELNAVADMSPSIWYPSPIIDSIVGAIGDRGKRYWPFKALIEAGADVIAGSDWPAVIPNMDPWTGIEAMVSRKHPKGEYPGAFWPEQAITLEQALHISTVGGARALKKEDQTGSIEVGKYADIIVLHHNIFEIPVEEISETKVLMTLFKGETVYRIIQN